MPRVLSLFLLLLVVAAPALAQELRISDEKGLIRALQTVPAEGAIVQVTLSPADPAVELRLSPVDGWAPERTALGGGGGVYRFDKVPPGWWQIRPVGGEVRIVAVRIQAADQQR